MHEPNRESTRSGLVIETKVDRSSTREPSPAMVHFDGPIFRSGVDSVATPSFSMRALSPDSAIGACTGQNNQQIENLGRDDHLSFDFVNGRDASNLSPLRIFIVHPKPGILSRATASKLYSFHAPQVECILGSSPRTKGKASAPYQFGGEGRRLLCWRPAHPPADKPPLRVPKT